MHFYLCSSVNLRQVFEAEFFISFAWTLVSPCILLSGFLKACVGAGWFVESMWCRITCWLYNTTMDYTSRIELYFSQFFFLFFRHSRFHGLDTVFARSLAQQGRCGWVCAGEPAGQGFSSNQRVNTPAWGGIEACGVDMEFRRSMMGSHRVEFSGWSLFGSIPRSLYCRGVELRP